MGNKMRKFISIFAITTIAVVLMFTITACVSIDTPVLVEGTTPSTEAANDATTSDAPGTFEVGQTAELNDIQVCLVEVIESTGTQFSKPADGNVFVLCEFEIANNSDEELNVSSVMSFEAYCDGYSCNYSFGALMAKGDKEQLDGTVAPGKKMNGVIGYEVPTDWKDLEVHFAPDVFSDKEFVFVATNDQ